MDLVPQGSKSRGLQIIARTSSRVLNPRPPAHTDPVLGVYKTKTQDPKRAETPPYPGNSGALDQASQRNEANSLLCGAISYVKTSFLYSAPGAILKKITNAQR